MEKINIWIALVFSLFLTLLIGFIFALIQQYLGIHIPKIFTRETSLIEQFMTAVVIAPIIETLLFQYLPILLLRNITKSSLILVLLSAIAFSATHYYSWLYVLVTFFIGIIFASFYLYAEKQKASPIWMTTLLHTLYNLILFIGKNS